MDVRSDICWSDTESVTVMGRDLCADLIGQMDFGSLAFLLLTEREPSAAEGALFNAALVSLTEHGITPNVLATRLTYLGAPESLQSAVAAGLLGLGSRFVGTIEGATKLLTDGVEALGGLHAAPSPEEITREAERIVETARRQQAHIPGIGHPIHTEGDPRTAALFAVVKRNGLASLPVELMTAVGAIASERSGRRLPVNVTGAIGASAVILGIDWRIARGLGVIARTVGLVGHLREELATPMATEVWYGVDEAATRHHRGGA